MKAIKIVLPVLILLPLNLFGQTKYVVVPKARASTDGNSLSHKPFAYSRIRLQHLVGRSEMIPLPRNAMLKGIDYRSDGKVKYTMKRNATALWTVRLGNTNVFPYNPSPYFYSATKLTTVFKPKAINWPNLPPSSTGTGSWLITFPFDTPFKYSGGNLIIDHYTYDAGSGRIFNYACDYEMFEYTHGDVKVFGTGCPKGANRVSGFAPNPGGGSFYMLLHGAKAGCTALACLGTNTSNWGGLALPFSLAQVGLPGCTIYTDLVVAVPTPVMSSGMAEISAVVPKNAALLGGRLYGQFLVLQDNRVNPAVPITTSKAMSITLGTRLSLRTPWMHIVSGTQSLARARYGLAFPWEGPVLRLKY